MLSFVAFASSPCELLMVHASTMISTLSTSQILIHDIYISITPDSKKSHYQKWNG
jgi:hypothetical protein